MTRLETSVERTCTPVQVLSSLLFWSFYFSQGQAWTQRKVLGYGREVHSDIVSALTVENRQQIIDTVTKKAMVWTTQGPHKPVPSDDIASEVTNLSNTLFGYDDTKPFDPAELTEELLRADGKRVRTGRQAGTDSGSLSVMQKAQMSHVWQYGLLQNPFPDPTLTKAYTLVRDRALTTYGGSYDRVRSLELRDLENIVDISRRHLETFPEQEITMTNLLPGIMHAVALRNNDPATIF